MKWLTSLFILTVSLTLAVAEGNAECHSCQGGSHGGPAYAGGVSSDVHYGGHYGYGNHTFGLGCGDYRTAHAADLWSGYCGSKQKSLCNRDCCYGKAYCGHGPFTKGHDLCCDGCGFGKGLAAHGLRKVGRCLSKFDVCAPTYGKCHGPRPCYNPRPCCKTRSYSKPRCGHFHLPKIHFPLFDRCQNDCCKSKCGSPCHGHVIKGGAVYGSPVYGHGVVSGGEVYGGTIVNGQYDGEVIVNGGDRVIDNSQVPTPAVIDDNNSTPEEVPALPEGEVVPKEAPMDLPMDLPLDLEADENDDPTA